MKNGLLGFVSLLLIAIFCLSISGCASARHGRVEVNPLANGEYDIYSVGGIVSDRALILKNWEDAANKACNGKYEITKEQTTGKSPAGAMTVDGKIRCK